jgi:hypothetical protein
VNTNPTVTVNSATICSGNNAVLTASGAATYSWSNGANTASVSVSPVATTVYTVTGYNGTCQGSRTVQVNVNATPTVAASNTTICSGKTATLTASGATSYSWSNGALTSSTAVSPVVTTVYTVNGTTGSCTGNKTVTVTVNPTPTVSVNSYTICPGGSATLTAAGATSYSWSNGAITNPVIVTPSVTSVYTTTGTAAGCTGTITSTVTIGAALSIIVSPSVQTKCSGSSATISASGATSYTWSNGSNANSIVVTPSANTTYSVVGTSGACSGSNTAQVNITPFATVIVNSASVLCFGQSNGTAGIVATGGAAPYTYSFSTGAVTQTVGALAAGNYTAVATTSAGCVTTSTFAIAQPAALNLVLNGTNTSCGNCNGSFSYLATGGTPGYNFTVSPGGVNNNLCAGIYTVVGTDANGCAMNSSINIGASSGITTIMSSTNASCGGCTDGSASVAVNGGTGPYSYTWSPNGGNAALANNLSDGCYTVTISDASNCVSTATTCVGVNTTTGIRKNVQNGTFKFYPNPTDGKLFIEFSSASERKIEVYDVTGRIIIEQGIYGPMAQLNMETLSNGVYYVQIKGSDGNRQFKIVKQ